MLHNFIHRPRSVKWRHLCKGSGTRPPGNSEELCDDPQGRGLRGSESRVSQRRGLFQSPGSRQQSPGDSRSKFCDVLIALICLCLFVCVYLSREDTPRSVNSLTHSLPSGSRLASTELRKVPQHSAGRRRPARRPGCSEPAKGAPRGAGPCGGLGAPGSTATSASSSSFLVCGPHPVSVLCTFACAEPTKPSTCRCPLTKDMIRTST